MPCRSKALHMCSTWHVLVLSCIRCQEWLSCPVSHFVGPGPSELVSIVHTLPVVLVAGLVCLMTDSGPGPTWCLALITQSSVPLSPIVLFSPCPFLHQSPPPPLSTLPHTDLQSPSVGPSLSSHVCGAK